MTTKYKSYTELMKIESFEDRLKYLQLKSIPGDGNPPDRYIRQQLYTSKEWKQVKRDIIIRDSNGDNALDLSHKDYPIIGAVYIHHINPITVNDILNWNYILLDPDNLIACSFNTHQDIHYLQTEPTKELPIERSLYDTCPWR